MLLMKVKATFQVLAKYIVPWNKDGVEHKLYYANIMQNSGVDIDKIRLTAEQYNLVEAGKIYTMNADYGTGKNGAYLRIEEIADGNK